MSVGLSIVAGVDTTMWEVGGCLCLRRGKTGSNCTSRKLLVLCDRLQREFLSARSMPKEHVEPVMTPNSCYWPLRAERY